MISAFRDCAAIAPLDQLITTVSGTSTSVSVSIEDFSLSPDGTRMAITRAARESDVVLVKRLK